MHKCNVLFYGLPSFFTTLNELKPFLKFNCIAESTFNNCEIILFSDDVLKDKKKKDLIIKSKLIKICVSKSRLTHAEFDACLAIPVAIVEINKLIEDVVAKKLFSINSSIKVKKYLLNKNEKKLIYGDNSIILTEKEIQLIELLLNKSKPITKDNILLSVWNYSTEADTHTVETHIYRLRKKISNKFFDEKFILNNKDGYFL